MNGPSMRITHPAAFVLEALDRGAAYGFDIMELTGLPSGTVYPILRRFEKYGLVRSEWEDASKAREKGRPRRRNYALTPSGHEALAEAWRRLEAQRRLFGGVLPERGS